MLERLDARRRAACEDVGAGLATPCPGCGPARAAALLAPLAAARQAVVYQHFLDHIEPSEHPYHRDDPPLWLAHAAARAR
jgi:hypothetical protein